jgi:hypothetical protein
MAYIKLINNAPDNEEKRLVPEMLPEGRQSHILPMSFEPESYTPKRNETRRIFGAMAYKIGKRGLGIGSRPL